MRKNDLIQNDNTILRILSVAEDKVLVIDCVKSANFEQIVELGVRLINLPPYRPELKGPVEKFFDIVQDLYKPYPSCGKANSLE